MYVNFLIIYVHSTLLWKASKSENVATEYIIDIHYKLRLSELAVSHKHVEDYLCFIQINRIQEHLADNNSATAASTLTYEWAAVFVIGISVTANKALRFTIKALAATLL